jgi:hypothetical protein
LENIYFLCALKEKKDALKTRKYFFRKVPMVTQRTVEKLSVSYTESEALLQ